MTDKWPSEAVPAQVLVYPGPPTKLPGESHQLTLGDLIRAVIAHKWIVLAFSLGGAVLIFLSSFLVPVRYTATAIYAPARNSGATSGTASLLEGRLGSLAGLAIGGAAENTQRLAALLKARAITLAALRGENALPALFPDHWDPAAKRWHPSMSWFDRGSGSAEPTPQDII